MLPTFYGFSRKIETVRVDLIPFCAWLEKPAYRLEVWHSILWFRYRESYIAAHGDFAGVSWGWDWWRVSDKHFVSREDLQKKLDALLCNHLNTN